ncbi:NUDIX domain-containing protein [Paenibacillus harenae]|uniref:NUDIX domain-containing protein n=1 Tax=Paenibacillus harenae TaxID=306543 RepID=UPI00040F8F1F|nr:NUDIX domain-containing protein [Paenibacillus harenae]
MKLRQMAAAFIIGNGKYLMMKKTNSKLADFEFWSALGGHMEPDEIGDPRGACLREIFEESGLLETDLHELSLRYVLLRQKEDEIRIQYYFFGGTDRSDVISSDEGELFWVEENHLNKLKMSAIVREMMSHYREHKWAENVFVGTITKDGAGIPQMQWSVMKDPIVF